MRRFKCFTLSILALILISCVNQDYDVQNINTDVIAGLKGITLPIGSTDKFFLADYLTDDLTDGQLKCDAQGNYYFSFSGETRADGVAVPDFSIYGFYDANSEHAFSEIPLIIQNLEQNRDFVTDVIKFNDLKFAIDIDQTDLPKQVIDISYADVEGKVMVQFSYPSSKFPFNCIWLASGTRVIFPECVILGDVPSGFIKISPNEVQFVDDFPIKSTGSSISFPVDALDMTALPENQGIISPGTIFVEQYAVVSGGFYLKASDCLSEGVFYPEFDAVISIDAMEIQYVTARVSVEESVFAVDHKLAVKDIPEFLDNDDFQLDFNNLRLDITLDNGSPLSGSLNAKIATGAQSETFWSADIDGLSFVPYAESRFSLSEDGTGAPEGYTDMAVAGFNSIMNRIPEIISLQSSLDVSDDYLEIVPGSEYSFGLEYGFDVPMSFGENLSIVLSEDIVDMNVEIKEVSLARAVVSLNFVNAIPLGLDVQAVAIDAMGQELPYINAEISQGVQPGTAGSPVTTPIEITLTCKDRLVFDGLRLGISVSSSSEGAVLNSNQYIQITDISLYLPDGIGYSK